MQGLEGVANGIVLKWSIGLYDGLGATDAILEDMNGLKDHQPVSNLQLRCLVKGAVKAFFHHDLYFAAKYFCQHQEGTFAITCSSSSEPRQTVLAAWGQPLSIGFSESSPACAWSSVAASLGIEMPGYPEQKIKFRLDLHDSTGEVVQLAVDPKSTECEADSPFFSPNKSGLTMRGEAVMGQMLTAATFAQRTAYPSDLTSPHLYDNLGSSIGSTMSTCCGTRGVQDPIAQDIQDIPR